MNLGPIESGDENPIDIEAADWVAKTDRGLKPDEQDDLSRWLAEDPRHRARYIRQTQTWDLLGGMRFQEPNVPDDLPRPGIPLRKGPRWWKSLGLTATLAALVTIGFLWTMHPSRENGPSSQFLSQNQVALDYERHVLEDGSVVELNRGAQVALHYTTGERRVSLLAGEAHFSVAKNPSRPFVVTAGDAEVRAVGTAFTVQLYSDSIEVMVTEGRVSMECPDSFTHEGIRQAREALIPELTVGQRVALPFEISADLPRIQMLSSEEMDQLLSWKHAMLDFVSTPLSHVVLEFNRRNRTQLVLGEAELGDLPITATFRSDNLQGFVRLLELTMGIEADRDTEDRVVLSK